MVRGLYTSALGMTTQMSRMDVVSNNIANVNTTAYKKDQVAAQSFSERLAKKIDDPGVLNLYDRFPIGALTQGVFIDEVYTDFTPGAFHETNGVLDTAIVGQGFFCVQVQGENGAETRYTRDGSFTLAQNGLLVTKDGQAVLGERGTIIIPNGDITIDQSGRIFSNDEYIDSLKMVSFENMDTLRKTENNYYITTGESNEIEFTGTIEQGFLENSNVQVVREMVELIALSRAYEANSKMIQTHDQSMSRAVNDIAKR